LYEISYLYQLVSYFLTYHCIISYNNNSKHYESIREKRMDCQICGNAIRDIQNAMDMRPGDLGDARVHYECVDDIENVRGIFRTVASREQEWLYRNMALLKRERKSAINRQKEILGNIKAFRKENKEIKRAIQRIENAIMEMPEDIAPEFRKQMASIKKTRK